MSVITNRKSHTGFRLISTSMTLNGVIALILRFFSPISVSLLYKYITVVEDRPIMSVNSVSQFQSSILGHKEPSCSAVSTLYAIPELLVFLGLRTEKNVKNRTFKLVITTDNKQL